MRASGPGFGRAAAVALVAVALDQITKAIVRGQVTPGDPVDLFAGVDIVRVSNRGIAFGLLDDAGSLVLVLAALAFAGLLAMFLAASDRRGLWLPIGLLAGGAIGNLIDRIHEGAVTDFVDIGPWPAFNLADVEITVGVVILVLMYAFGPEPEGEDPPPTGVEPPGPEPESQVSPEPRIVWEDDHLAVVDKPAGPDRPSGARESRPVARRGARRPARGAATTPSDPGSSTGSTRTPRAC